MSLWAEAFKRVAAIKLAEFRLMYEEELERRVKKDDDEEADDGPVTSHVHLEPENPDLLAGAIVAKRRIGFGLPDTSSTDGDGTEVQDSR